MLREFGLINMNARLYDPALMKFLSPDPLIQHGSPYAYCSNNPLKYTDPMGMYENVRKHRKGGEEGGHIWVGMNRGMSTDHSYYGNWVNDYVRSVSGDFGNYAFQEYSDSKKERNRTEIMKADFNLFLKEVASYLEAGFEINIAVRPEGIYGISIRDGKFLLFDGRG